MDNAAIRDMSDQELAAAIAERREAARKARFGEAGARSGNVRAARGLRRDVARMLTALGARAKLAKTKEGSGVAPEQA